jgi:sugar-specific transcriptional regulator TrmB
MLTLKSEDVEALTCLGLTVLQAKVYLALTSSGKATIKTISKTANVARQDIYRLVAELQELGIVEKIIAAPNEFRAIPLRDGTNILLKRKQKENSDAHKKALKLIQRHKDENTNAQPEEEKPQFIMIPEKKALTLRLKEPIETAQESIDSTCSWKKFPNELGILAEAVEKALRRGVKIRFVIEKPEHTNSLPKTAQVFMKNPYFKLRTIPYPPTGILCIIDKKEVLLATSTAGSTVGSPALWTSNPSLLAIVQEYFEQMWLTSKTEKYKTQNKALKTRSRQIFNSAVNTDNL